MVQEEDVLSVPQPAGQSSDFGLDRSAMQKTPISLLQEMCTKRGLTPQYELLSTEGQVHEPTFMFRARVVDTHDNNYIASGSGKSKKVAKHIAAAGVLKQLVVLNEGKDWTIGDVPPEDAVEYVINLLNELQDGMNSIAGAEGNSADNTPVAVIKDTGSVVSSAESSSVNAVGRLQELCMTRRWPPPIYEMKQEEGQPHERMFKMEVKLGNFVQTGEGRSKKVAKRIGAEKMLDFLTDIPPEEEDTIPTAEDATTQDDHTTLATMSDAGGMMRQPVVGKIAAELDALSVCDKKPKRDAGSDILSGINPNVSRDILRNLGTRDLDCELPSIEHVRLLRQLCVDEGWKAPQFTVLPNTSKKGHLQCMVQIGREPNVIGVCHGSSDVNADEAKQKAAHNALEFLKNMAVNLVDEV